jgi:NADPH:quinone reductase-like Zn-dependent oxidoreductase
LGREVIVFPGLAGKMTIDKMRGYYPLCEDFGMLGAHRDGGCAELAVVPADSLLDKPPEVSWVEGASLPIAFMTAWHMLFDRAKLQPGETVLIHSAGSGVSHGAIQMAQMIGARVIATSSSVSKLEHARELGADEGIDYTKEDVGKRVRELTGGRGADVVLDHNGTVTWAASMKALGRGGRLVVCGVTQGAEVSLDLGALFYKAQSILGSTIGTREELATVIGLVAAGRIRPMIDRVYGLSEIRAAHERMEAPERFGKVVIEVGK